MIEGWAAGLSLNNLNVIFGIAAGFITMVIGLIKLRKRFVLCFYRTPKRAYLRWSAKRRRMFAEKIFEEMRPMLEQEILDALDGYTVAVREQKVTIASAIAENVEFRNFITGTISVMNDTLSKMATAVEINANDARVIRTRLSDGRCSEAGSCTKRFDLKAEGGKTND